ncbi:Structural maintenance of chromosomes protein 6B-like protein [Drosera capensis]
MTLVALTFAPRVMKGFRSDAWSIAVENAIGRLLDSLIVTDYQDSRLLRQFTGSYILCGPTCHLALNLLQSIAKWCRLVIPDNRVPRTGHPTILSILHPDNPTVMNVLVDKGLIERQVLVQDYEMGKEVTFVQRVPNLKEVHTKEDFNMFFRGSVQTILPPNRRCRAGRLCSTYGDQIEDLKREVPPIKQFVLFLAYKESYLERTFKEFKKTECDVLLELAKVASNDMGEATNDLSGIKKLLHTTNMEKAQLEKVLSEKLIPAIKEAEQELGRLQNQREEYYEKASLTCPESEVEALGGCNGSTPEQLSAQLNRFKLPKTQSNPDSIDDLRLMFNGHLGKKGISGNIKVSYEEKTLAIEVKRPQDASSIAVRDTRSLSGGERSFSTLCFAMALHEMVEAPFRAMNEFDVFMYGKANGKGKKAADGSSSIMTVRPLLLQLWNQSSAPVFFFNDANASVDSVHLTVFSSLSSDLERAEEESMLCKEY